MFEQKFLILLSSSISIKWVKRPNFDAKCNTIVKAEILKKDIISFCRKLSFYNVLHITISAFTIKLLEKTCVDLMKGKYNEYKGKCCTSEVQGLFLAITGK